MNVPPFARCAAHALAALLTAATAYAQTTVAAPAARLYPTVAAPGETVWLINSGLPDQGRVWIGAQVTPYTRDRPSGWLAFTVPERAAGGPQTLGLNGPAPQAALTLTVLDRESRAQDLLAYVPPAAVNRLRSTFPARLRELSASCARTRCPEQVQAVIARLGALSLPPFTPLDTTGRPPAPPSPVVGRPPLGLPTPPAPAAAPVVPDLRALPQQPPALVGGRTSGICSALTATLPTAGLPAGQVITLLSTLFGPDLQVDPTGYGHPDEGAAPYRQVAPAELLSRILGFRGGNGKGVTVHILDTADGRSDPFVAAPPPNYYGELYPGRPGHGRVIAQITQAAAPNATVVNRAVCDPGGRCSTLKVAQALCAVAAEARRGGRHVVNLSAGGPYPVRGLHLALQEVTGAGVPVVASYGNRDDCADLRAGDRCWHYPADWSADFATGPAVAFGKSSAQPTLLFSVAGWDVATRQLATYNRGVGTPGVLVLPPGVQAPGEFWVGSFPYFGSSFAAPVVSGLLANWMTCRAGVPLLPLVAVPGQVPLRGPGRTKARTAVRAFPVGTLLTR
ncbi:S8 family serine peptidase [Deinococcus taeanensis]|uniref:S8 family serine peptidase n=1 Tax=Deinococcus taeanensis TaxID=2737050 RepID=UPI001CDD3D04|nr:S8 family serine peptidase [Deinococcus taeanensis]UBV43333.1 S8 family serine peptidase [Deinococcus taeanensis]